MRDFLCHTEPAEQHPEIVHPKGHLGCLGNFLRTRATPEPIKDWSLTSLKEKLIKIGAKVVSHGRYVVFQMAEVAFPRQMLREILRNDRGTTAAASACASMRGSMSCIQEQSTGGVCPNTRKMARSAASAAVRGARGDGSHPRRQPVLPECGKNAKIFPHFGVHGEFRNE